MICLMASTSGTFCATLKKTKNWLLLPLRASVYPVSAWNGVCPMKNELKRAPTDFRSPGKWSWISISSYLLRIQCSACSLCRTMQLLHLWKFMITKKYTLIFCWRQSPFQCVANVSVQNFLWRVWFDLFQDMSWRPLNLPLSTPVTIRCVN